MLKRWGVAFDVVAPGIDERPPQPLGPLRFVAWAAEAKARAVAGRFPGAVVVAADTEVVRRRRIWRTTSTAKGRVPWLDSMIS